MSWDCFFPTRAPGCLVSSQAIQNCSWGSFLLPLYYTPLYFSIILLLLLLLSPILLLLPMLFPLPPSYILPTYRNFSPPSSSNTYRPRFLIFLGSLENHRLVQSYTAGGLQQETIYIYIYKVSMYAIVGFLLSSYWDGRFIMKKKWWWWFNIYIYIGTQTHYTYPQSFSILELYKLLNCEGQSATLRPMLSAFSLMQSRSTWGHCAGACPGGGTCPGTASAAACWTDNARRPRRE